MLQIISMSLILPLLKGSLVTDFCFPLTFLSFSVYTLSVYLFLWWKCTLRPCQCHLSGQWTSFDPVTPDLSLDPAVLDVWVNEPMDSVFCSLFFFLSLFLSVCEWADQWEQSVKCESNETEWLLEWLWLNIQAKYCAIRLSLYFSSWNKQKEWTRGLAWCHRVKEREGEFISTRLSFLLVCYCYFYSLAIKAQ